MPTPFSCVRTILVVFLLLASPVALRAKPIPPGELTDQHVDAAIAALVDALVELKDGTTFWEPDKWPPEDSSRQGGGYTALAALALLHAGHSYQHPHLRDAIEWLETREMIGTYAVAARSQVWAKLPPRFQTQLDSDTRWLLEGFSPKGPGWDYVQSPRTKRADNSVRHYVMLAIWEAAKRGAKIDTRLWKVLEAAFIDAQLPDGGWNYTCDDSPPRASMTAAGLTALFITQDFLHAREYLGVGRRRESQAELSINSGLEWMNKNFSPTKHTGHTAHFYYYMYGVERVGLASGYRSFGGHDWFREGAAELIDRLLKRDDDGAFTPRRQPNKARAVRRFSFALLFLSRGRSPVAFNKLKIDGMEWNSRPRALANFSRWLGERTEGELLWQIVDSSAPAEAWLDAPLLCLSSHERLTWTAGLRVHLASAHEEAQKNLQERLTGAVPLTDVAPKLDIAPELAKLKTYLDQGGMLLAMNEGSGGRFAASIETAGVALYPHLVWRDLEDDHWAYTLHHSITTRKPKLRGLSNGVRELIVLARDDLPRTFQGRQEKNSSHYDAMANLYFYASELGADRPRLSTALPPVDPSTLESITVARAMHAGNWNPEPGALPRWAHHVGHAQQLAVHIVDHPLGLLHTLPAPPDLLIVSGIKERAFTATELKSVETYVRQGGVVLFESPGGKGDFTSSAEAAVGTLFGSGPGPIGETAIITGEGLSGTKLGRVGYRPYALQQFGARVTAPRLRGMTVDGAVRVLFSREDISHALLGRPVWGVSGYDTQTARDLMTNILLYARSQRKTSAR